MNVFEFAMKMEKDGESYYRELANRTVSGGLKKIFTMLADAEVVHYVTFRKMKDNESVEPADIKILSETKNMFLRMKEEEKGTDLTITQTELYKKANEAEKESRDFYLEQANKAADPAQKKIFTKIADEEQRHYMILEEIVNFVARPEVGSKTPNGTTWRNIRKRDKAR